jgi:hypothetical protein
MSITNAALPSTNAVFPLSITGLSSVGYGRGATLLTERGDSGACEGAC